MHLRCLTASTSKEELHLGRALSMSSFFFLGALVSALAELTRDVERRIGSLRLLFPRDLLIDSIRCLEDATV